MTNFRAAIALSLAVHVILFFSVRPFSFLNKAQFDKHDYHLPVELELSKPEPVRAHALKVVQPSVKQVLLPDDATTSDEFFLDRIEKKKKLQQTNDSELAHRKQQSKGVSMAPPAETLLQSNKAWNRSPIYPDRARQLGQEGRVLLDVQLSDSGKVIGVQVARSTGFVELDESAIQAVSTWTMDPPKNNDRRIFIPVTFKLESKSSNR